MCIPGQPSNTHKLFKLDCLFLQDPISFVTWVTNSGDKHYIHRLYKLLDTHVLHIMITESQTLYFVLTVNLQNSFSHS